MRDCTDPKHTATSGVVILDDNIEKIRVVSQLLSSPASIKLEIGLTASYSIQDVPALF